MNQRMAMFATVCAALAALLFFASRGRTPEVSHASSNPAHMLHLAVCGDEELYIIEFDAEADAPVKTKKVWTWRAASRSDMPQRLKHLFKTTSEIKPAGDGKHLFIAAKEGGVAMIEQRTGAVKFATLLHLVAYSAELLPHDRIAVVGGDGKEGLIAIYDMDNPDRPLLKEDFTYAHATYWDEKRKLLWAVGWSELRAYELADWQTFRPKLVLRHTYKLPGESGHDLLPNPGTDELFVTLHEGVWMFNLKTRRFTPHPTLGSKTHVKSISVHPENGRVAYVQAQEISWWASQIKMTGRYPAVSLAGEKVYTARWVEGP